MGEDGAQRMMRAIMEGETDPAKLWRIWQSEPVDSDLGWPACNCPSGEPAPGECWCRSGPDPRPALRLVDPKA